MTLHRCQRLTAPAMDSFEVKPTARGQSDGFQHGAAHPREVENDKSSNSCEHSAWRRAGPLPCTRDMVQHSAAFQMLEGVLKFLCAPGRESNDFNDSDRSTFITSTVRVTCRNSQNPTAEVYSCGHHDCDAMIVRVGEKVVAHHQIRNIFTTGPSPSTSATSSKETTGMPSSWSTSHTSCRRKKKKGARCTARVPLESSRCAG